VERALWASELPNRRKAAPTAGPPAKRRKKGADE
jgi:hypothetical protein